MWPTAIVYFELRQDEIVACADRVSVNYWNTTEQFLYNK